jgi:sec-independent protein translocase protein TatC
MELFKELEELKKVILSVLLIFVILTFVFFLVGLREVNFLGKDIIIPYPQLNSFSAEIFNKMQKDLVPPGVELIVTGPLSAFSAQAFISMCLSLMVGSPYFLYKIISYLTPVLSGEEKRKIAKVWFPSLFLFLGGCAFAYIFLIPLTLDVLYKYPAILGANSFLNIGEFVFFSMGIMIVVGLIFLLPAFMILLSSLGLIKKNFWKKNWRYAMIIFLIFSAVITPDGSGLTMILLSVPLSGLYFLGYALSPK